MDSRICRRAAALAIALLLAFTTAASASEPVISIISRGNYVAFTSNQAGLAGETNGPGLSDVFLEFTMGAPGGG
jgi:hypothetical protein